MSRARTYGGPLLKPLTPIFDEKKKRGSTQVGTSPGTRQYILEFQDTFDRANAATLGGNWETPDGNWTIAANTATQTTGATDLVRYLVPISSTNHWVRGTRESPTTGALTVCCRMNAAKTQFYMAGYNTATTTWQIQKFDGLFTTLASYFDILSGGHVYFRLEAFDNILRLMVGDPEGINPTEIMRVEDASFAHQYSGIRGNSGGGTINVLDDFGAGVFG